MDIHFTECNCEGVGLFADFARYETVEKYLQALVDVMSGKTEYMSSDAPDFVPLDCAVKDINNGQCRWIIQAGQVHPDADKNIRWMKRQRAEIRHFMSDYITIVGDGFERELFFSWN